MSAVVGLLGIVVAPPGVVVTALVLPLFLVVGAVVASRLTVFAIAFGVANLAHPKFVAFPNVHSFPSRSSSVELVAEAFVDSSIDALSNDDPCSHSSSLRVYLHKKIGTL